MIPRKSGSTGLAAWGVLAALTVLLLLTLAPIGGTAVASPLPQSYLLSDDFAQDTQLNTTIWEVSGPAATNFSAENCPSCTLVPLAPSFSSSGMEVAQVNGSYEVGAIQSIASFAPPFTVTTGVEGVVSNGHTFVFGITSFAATSGVQITGNLDPRDCSNETNCADPATCSIPANPSVPANQCYYGIYGRIGTGNGNWAKTPVLSASPSVGTVYTLQVSVDTSGLAQFNVSQAGQLIGSSSGQVGAGPFYIILAQSEGAPVPGPGPNQAYWFSVSVTPTAPPPPPAAPASNSLTWVLILIVVVLALIVLVVAARRRRKLTITVVDSGTMAPVQGAGVWAEGPRSYGGSTGTDGRVTFGGVAAGDYAVRASGTGYSPSGRAVVAVRRTAGYTVRLDRGAIGTQDVGPAAPPPPSPGPVAPTAGAAAGAAATPAPIVSLPRPEPPLAPARIEGEDEADGWGGERLRQIMQTFRAKGALSPETALTADELGLSRIFVRIMKRRRGRTRVFVEVGGKYYLDERALHGVK